MDETEITLPVSGKKVVIRNYTTHADDEASERMLYDGVNAETDSSGQQKFELSMSKIMSAKSLYVDRLVKSIDGDTSNLKVLLGELRTPDYNAVKEAVDKIVEEFSPKAPEAVSASANTTEKK